MKKAAVIFNAGIGNALLVTGLCKKLISTGYSVDAFFTKKAPYHEFFSVFNNLYTFTYKLNTLSILNNIKKYHDVYLDFFAVNKKNLLFAHLLGKNVHYKYYHPIKLPFYSKFYEIIPHLHELHQNSSFISKYNIENNGLLNQLKLDLDVTDNNQISSKYVVLQPIAGNNNAPYKTWPLAEWQKAIKQIICNYPEIKIVVIGDCNEFAALKTLEKLHHQVINLTGKTSLQQVAQLILNSQLFMGCDSGFMHLAALLGKPTITIWGGSDPEIFGYENINNQKHKIFKNNLFCQPCNRYYAPNTIKTNNPLHCPDFNCLKSLHFENIGQSFMAFFVKHIN